MKSTGAAVTRIMVVDDEPSIHDFCARVLNKEGFSVSCAFSGRVAQDMIEEKKWALYLVDIRMPDMSGMELYQWLEKKHPKLASQVIFTTGDVIGGDVSDFLEHVNRPFLLKPFTARELITTVIETLKETRKWSTN
ncbi:MAG: response regulator [Dehalococcoidia bacterium]